MCCSVASYSRDELGENHVLLAVASYSRDLVRVRQRSRCKECGGGGICEHGRWGSQCKECAAAAASAMNEHGRPRYRSTQRCKDCGGSKSI